jgi:signal peptidase I
VRNPLDRLTHRLPGPWRVAIDWVVTIVAAVAIVLAIKQWVVNPYRIPSASMEPTLHCARGGESECTARFSDRVLANRFIYRFVDPKRGDIVVFETPRHAQRECAASGTFVKRIVALPGESWEMRDGRVFINGSRLEEPYVTADRRDGDTQPPKKIPDDHYFVMGDNRGSSCDSRVWGPLPRASLIGKVFAVYFPPRRIGLR